jgi:hypothetical protein
MEQGRAPESQIYECVQEFRLGIPKDFPAPWYHKAAVIYENSCKEQRRVLFVFQNVELRRLVSWIVRHAGNHCPLNYTTRSFHSLIINTLLYRLCTE